MFRRQLLIALGIATVAVLPAFSAQRTSETTSLRLNESNPRLGYPVTFTATVPKKMEHYLPRIQVLCYQSGVLVYGAAGLTTDVFTLGGAYSQWRTNGGPADCVADLYYHNDTTRRGSGETTSAITYPASTSFHAEG